jgi:hypothetical protein
MAMPIPSSNESAVPQGLLKTEPEKKMDESQMAEFSSAIEEVMPGPGQMLQNEIMGPPHLAKRRSSSENGDTAVKSSKNPLGLTDDQFQAVIAGVAAVIAFSKPIQDKLRAFVPKFVGESGEVSMTGLIASALVAAIIFYFARRINNP